MRRHPDGVDERPSSTVAREPVIVVSAEDNDFFVPMDGHVLRPLVFRASYYLTEPGFGLLQLPLPRSHAA